MVSDYSTQTQIKAQIFGFYHDSSLENTFRYKNHVNMSIKRPQITFFPKIFHFFSLFWIISFVAQLFPAKIWRHQLFRQNQNKQRSEILSERPLVGCDYTIPWHETSFLVVKTKTKKLFRSCWKLAEMAIVWCWNKNLNVAVGR